MTHNLNLEMLLLHDSLKIYKYIQATSFFIAASDKFDDLPARIEFSNENNKMMTMIFYNLVVETEK